MPRSAPSASGPGCANTAPVAWGLSCVWLARQAGPAQAPKVPVPPPPLSSSLPQRLQRLYNAPSSACSVCQSCWMFSLHSRALSMSFSDRSRPAEVGRLIIASVPPQQKCLRSRWAVAGDDAVRGLPRSDRKAPVHFGGRALFCVSMDAGLSQAGPSGHHQGASLRGISIRGCAVQPLPPEVRGRFPATSRTPDPWSFLRFSLSTPPDAPATMTAHFAITGRAQETAPVRLSEVPADAHRPQPGPMQPGAPLTTQVAFLQHHYSIPNDHGSTACSSSP